MFFARRILQLAVKCYVIYFFLSLLVLWPLLNYLANPLYKGQTGRPLAYDLIGFNPFTLSVFAYGLADHNPDGSTLWSAEAITLNPSLLKSIGFGALAFDAIDINGLSLEPEQVSESRFNFSDIVQYRQSLPPSPETPDTSDKGLPRIKITHFGLQANLLQFTDSSRPRPFRNGLRDFAFSLEDFSTLSEDGDGYSLRAEGFAGGVISWRGDLSALGKKTWGHFSVENLSLLPFWEFMEPSLAFQLSGGTLDFSTDYEINWANDLQWQLTQAALQIANIQTRATNVNNSSQLGFTQLAIAIDHINSQQQEILVDSIVLDNLQLASWHDEQNVGLMEMFVVDTGQHSAKSEPTPANTQPWHWRIKHQAVQNAQIDWRVPELNNRELHIAPLQFKAENFNSGDEPAQLTLGFLIDQQARFSATGVWHTPDQALSLTSSLDQLPLAWINPILTQQARAHVSQGELASEQLLTLSQGQPKQLSLNVQIDNLQTQNDQQLPLLALKQLNLNDAQIDFVEKTAEIQSLDIDNFQGSIKIFNDGSTNFSQLFIDSSPEQSNVKPDIKSTHAQQTGRPQAPDQAWQWSLGQLALNDAQVDFTDETPLSPFSAHIQNFSGTIAPIKSDANSPLQVDFKGNVDGYAPVTLKGWAKPLLSEPAMDLGLKFSAMDLGVFNPYSTTFTGWKINKGLLTVEMTYGLQDKRIVGNNRVVLDQLELGERVDSRRLVDIPLRLALALLTDENGVADLAVPVSGTTDDPEFSVGSIIWAAVRNSIMKIITAPFNLLASLAGSDEDLGEIAFAPLASELNLQAQSKLKALKTALDKRPQLRIGITGDLSAEEIQSLKQRAVDETLLAMGAKQKDLDSHNSSWRKLALEALASETLPEKPDDETIIAMLLDKQPMPSAAIDALVKARALSAKQYLLNQQGLAPKRVFVQSDTLDCSQDNHCQGARAFFEISQ